MERTLAVVISHIGQEPCNCSNVGAHWSFSSQILTIPFLWRLLPHLKEVTFNDNTFLIYDLLTPMVMALKTIELLIFFLTFALMQIHIVLNPDILLSCFLFCLLFLLFNHLLKYVFLVSNCLGNYLTNVVASFTIRFSQHVG